MRKLKYFPFYFISVLPLRILYSISDMIFIIIYYIIKYRRSIVRLNLKNSFPEKETKEIVEIEKKFYKHFCDIAVESIKLLTVNKKFALKRLSINNMELINELLDKKRSIILYTAHFGNWEWLSFLPLLLQYKATTFYQPLSNKYFNKLMLSIRSKFGGICVESNKGYKALIKYKDENELTFNCIIGDQSPGKQSPAYWTMFLHRKTAFLEGADRIAKKTNQALVFPSFKKVKRGFYEVSFLLIEEFPNKTIGHEIIEKYAHILEQNITNSPELWLWSHRRWKLTHPG